MTTVTFSIWDGGKLITEYPLDIQEENIEKSHIDASSVWDEYTVLSEWGDGKTATIMPFTYSNSLNGVVSNNQPIEILL